MALRRRRKREAGRPLQKDTGPAKLPGLPAPPTTGDPALDQWIKLAAERLEVREGKRGNPYERAVTVRELEHLYLQLDEIEEITDGIADLIDGDIEGGVASAMIDAFIKSIKDTQLYKDLVKRLDDPSRFDRIPGEVRELLLADLREEAAARGAAITRVEQAIQDVYRSLFYRVTTITAAVERAQAGIREVSWSTAETNYAQAGKITQLEASLGNYYQDGEPGRAMLEESMTATADSIDGLEAQYTLKVQAGGALAGFGIAATEVDGVPSSAFILSADKFAIVSPNYNAGLTNTPNMNHIPFGVDTNGIYLNQNVYVRGSMRIDTGGKRLADGLRGSVNVNAGTVGWSDNLARNAVWQHLGKGGSPPNNNHLVVGDTVRLGNTTRTWNGSAWQNQGVFINGSMVVDGSLGARHIDTRGLVVRDYSGNPILGAGVPLPSQYLTNAPKGADITNDANTQVTVNGQKLKTTDFVNRLSKINNSNISAFMESAAIGNAYIGNAAVDTLKIQGNAVTIPVAATGNGYIPSVSIPMTQPGTVLVMGACNWLAPDSSPSSGALSVSAGNAISSLVGVSMPGGYSGSAVAVGMFSVGAGQVLCRLWESHTGNRTIGATAITVIGAMR